MPNEGSNNTEVPQPTPTITNEASPEVSLPSNSMLFLDTDEFGAAPEGPQFVRYRFVKINLDLLLHKNQKARRDVTEITINLFPDVVFTGVIENLQSDGSGASWNGHLKNIEYSSMFLVYTSGVFIGHFASPQGVYEVSFVGENDLYRVVQIDQQSLPGAGND